MKRLFMAACLILTFAAFTVIWIDLPPRRTRELPIPEDFVSWLRQEHPEDLARRLRDPLEVSLRLLYHAASDPINTRGMTINVGDDDDGNRIVTIDDQYVEDDSISRSYSRIVLRRDGLSWIPIEHRIARQGRGVFGWTTGPTN